MKKFGRYHFTHVYQSTPSPLPPLKISKIKILKKMKKNAWRYGNIILLHIHTYHISTSYDVYFLRYGAQQTELFVILDCFFALLQHPPPLPLLSFYKCVPCQSYNVWFLRYGTWWTEFFAILGHFLPFYPPSNPKNLKFEKMKKKTWRYYHFTHVHHK